MILPTTAPPFSAPSHSGRFWHYPPRRRPSFWAPSMDGAASGPRLMPHYGSWLTLSQATLCGYPGCRGVEVRFALPGRFEVAWNHIGATKRAAPSTARLLRAALAVGFSVAIWAAHWHPAPASPSTLSYWCRADPNSSATPHPPRISQTGRHFLSSRIARSGRGAAGSAVGKLSLRSMNLFGHLARWYRHLLPR